MAVPTEDARTPEPGDSARPARPRGRWGVVVVRGRSMQPTLLDGDRVLVRYAGRPRPGRVLLVLLPDNVVAVKRAVGRVEGGWWVARDNPEEGVDSAQVGAVPVADVWGVAAARLAPRPRWLRRRR